MLYMTTIQAMETKTYFITKNKPKLTTFELALICDDGNLCFGFDVTASGIKIYTD